ncbi:MAG: Bax inhibitor-1/YccA family protein [Verrucomicrobiae bacterium]
MNNPLFNENRIQSIACTSGEAMTVSGTIHKTTLLAAVTAGTATLAWSLGSTPFAVPVMIGGLIFGLISVFAASWKPTLSPVLAPVYAVCEGAALGVISAMYNHQSGGLVAQAVLITFGILFAMLALFQFRVIRVTEKFRSVVFACTAGIALMYLVNLGLSLFHINMPFLNGGGSLGILLSLGIIVIASLNFLVDFDNIEKGAAANAPKYYEWLAGLGVLVTLVWLYVEVLRLLLNLNRR